MPPVPDFAAHRARLLERLAEDEALLLFGSEHAVRNGDAEYRYRPDSDITWLTGWEDPDVAVFLRPGDEPFTLFCQPKDKERETWTGIRPGPAGAIEQFGADRAFAMAELEKELTRLVQGVRTLHYAFAVHPDLDGVLMSCISQARRAARYNGMDIPEVFVSPTKLLHELRLKKGPDEIAVLERSAAITEAGHRAAMQCAAPGVYEFEVEAALTGAFRRMGSTGPGYVPIVAGGNHANVLHYVTNREALADGDLLLLDAGAEHCYYTADVTRTFPVNGRYTPVQRALYEWVLRAQKAAIAVAVPGRTFKEVHDAAVRVLVDALLDLDVLSGDPEDLIKDEAYKPFYMHGTSHWLGLDVHDVGAYGRDGQSRTLEPGIVLTVEPGLYLPADADDVPKELRGIGIRIEDDLLVVDGGNRVLTAAIPKEIDEVEAACS